MLRRHLGTIVACLAVLIGLLLAVGPPDFEEGRDMESHNYDSE